ncbi:hypothetical protein [Weissella minor]|uniref:Phosphatidate cytidylyltransferase n=1 Tax=Weissella minor TaxID=1620 RepID=A0A0R2JNQ1_9LACO|nr:hypothetical protein [Weissella minor]KRN77510.1 hypothetical protein IV67_GL001567 [Weissella minor]
MKEKVDVVLPIVVLILVIASMIYTQDWLKIVSTLALSGYLAWDWRESGATWKLVAAIIFILLLLIRLYL